MIIIGTSHTSHQPHLNPTLWGEGQGMRTWEKGDRACLPFTRANRSVFRLGRFGQMVSKFPYWESFCSGLALTICRNPYHLPKKFPFGTFHPEKTGLPFQTFRCSRKFSTGTTQKVVYHLLSNRNFRKVVVNGKQPRSLWGMGKEGTRRRIRKLAIQKDQRGWSQQKRGDDWD